MEVYGSVWQQVKGWFRSVIFFVMFVIGILGFGLWIMALWPVRSLKHRRACSYRWAVYNRQILAMTCGITDRVEGLEQLPPPPYIILAKHQSAWETVVFLTIFSPCVLVLKESLMWIPVFGWALRATQQIAIDRSRGVAALNKLNTQGMAQLREGVSVLIFPEGTRQAPGVPGKYNPGGVGLALTAGVPIVPVAHNAGSFWPRRTFLKKPGEIQVRIGAPLQTSTLGRSDRKALQTKVEEVIEGMMADIQPHSL